MRDTRFLTKKEGDTWRVTKRVPRHLHGILGKRHYRESTNTPVLVEAQKRRWPILGRIQTIIDEAERRYRAGATMEEAMAWRAHIAKLKAGDLSGIWDSRFPAGGPELRRAALVAAADFIEEEAEAIAAKHGPAAAEAFTGIATGTATPLLHHLDDALREGGNRGPLNARTQQQFRSAVLRFAAWCERASVPATVEAIGKSTVGRYVTDEFVAANVDPATSNKHISFLSSYWRWLIRRTDLTANPWSGQRRSKAARRDNGHREPRPFTDAEIVALLQGDKDQELDDVIRVGALTGARLDELYRLTVKDCQGGVFDICDDPKAGSFRLVPIHSALIEIVARRCAGKAPTDFLFHEAGGPSPTGKDRSAKMSKRFGRYRQSVGVHEKPEGQRHSLVNFHSFRRWFTTTARNAGVDYATVAAVDGHTVNNLTDGTYSGGPTMAMRRACVEAVRLPS